MRFPTGCSLLVLAALVLVPFGDLAPDADAKGKKASCKGQTVAVKIGKRKTCRPFAKLFPAPKDVDLRLAYLSDTLRTDPAELLRSAGRRRGGTPPSVTASVRRAQKKILRALPKSLAKIDRGARRSALSSIAPPGLATASAGCHPNGDPSPVGHSGGGSLGSMGDNGGYIEAPAGNGVRVRVTFVECKPPHLGIPECPTADGKVDSRKLIWEFRATTEVWDDDRLISRSSTDRDEELNLHGEVGPDAKLKAVEVEHVWEELTVAGGGQASRGGVKRRVRIEMPAGQYNPAQASVTPYGDSVSLTSSGKGFADRVHGAINAYRNVEPRWSSFDRRPFCARAIFSPAGNTQKVRKGQALQFSVHATAASDGGRATGARWTFTNQLNALFTPASSQEPGPTVAYTVTNAPEGGFIEVTAKFTSTAGVGEDRWKQPTEKSGAINKIAGTFNLKSILHVTQGDSVAEWSGNATFERYTPAIFGGASGFYKFKSGFLSVSFSGNAAMTGSTPLCSQKGSRQLSFSAVGSTFSAVGTGSEQVEPYEYGFGLSSENSPLPMVDIELYNCAPPADELEGEEFEYPATFSMTNSGSSADGLGYAGTDSNLISGSGTTEAWSFTGSE